MRKNFFPTVFLVLIIFLATTIIIQAADDSIFEKIDKSNNLRLGNDYVVIVVNQDENGQGRFAIETTGGAPLRDNDDQKPLVYGRPKPWTSYTTIKINGNNYVFGGSTERRAGKHAKYGKIVLPPQVKNESIHTVTKINGLLIDQGLQIVKSSTTGLYDAVQIKYRIKNTTEKEQNVGLRIMLDTMLGKNDGAPFRIGNKAVTNDKLYLQEDLPTFWQAFDSISLPQVTSQGAFKGFGVTTPDKVYFADWGSLADGTWNFDFNPGEEFIRKGEYETDSAIALQWKPEPIAPGEVKTYTTKYGLGGITIVPGLISLGVTSPSEVTFSNQNNSFPVIAYIENTSEIEAKNVKISINLPESFTTINPKKQLGNFESGDIAQVIWQVKPAGNKIPSEIDYQVSVEAKNTDSNQVKRNVKFVGPPELKTTLKAPDSLNVKFGQLKPNPFPLQVEVTNKGGSTLYDVKTELQLPPGLTLAAKEINRKYLGYLEKGETVKLNWKIRALKVTGTLPFAVNTSGMDGYKTQSISNIDIPELNPLLYLQLQSEIDEQKYIIIDLKGRNLEDINKMDLTLTYNPSHLKPIYVSPGNIFVRGEEVTLWEMPNLSRNGLIKLAEELPSNISTGTIARIQFKVLNQDKIALNWNKISCFGNDNNKINVDIKNLMGGTN